MKSNVFVYRDTFFRLVETRISTGDTMTIRYHLKTEDDETLGTPPDLPGIRRACDMYLDSGRDPMKCKNCGGAICPACEPQDDS